MSDDEKVKEYFDAWKERLSSSVPVETYEVDRTIGIGWDGEGAVCIDCAGYRMDGLDEVGIVRFVLDHDAVGILYRALAEYRKQYPHLVDDEKRHKKN